MKRTRFNPMKTTSYIVAFTLCAAAKAMALDQLDQKHTDAASTRVEMKSAVTVNPFVQTKQITDNNRIERIGGMSSQPWSQIAVRNSGPDMLSDMQNQETEFPLLWIGAKPLPF